MHWCSISFLAVGFVPLIPQNCQSRCLFAGGPSQCTSPATSSTMTSWRWSRRQRRLSWTGCILQLCVCGWVCRTQPHAKTSSGTEQLIARPKTHLLFIVKILYYYLGFFLVLKPFPSPISPPNLSKTKSAPKLSQPSFAHRSEIGIKISCIKRIAQECPLHNLTWLSTLWERHQDMGQRAVHSLLQDVIFIKADLWPSTNGKSSVFT